jgi:hypothetical protein
MLANLGSVPKDAALTTKSTDRNLIKRANKLFPPPLPRHNILSGPQIVSSRFSSRKLLKFMLSQLSLSHGDGGFIAVPNSALLPSEKLCEREGDRGKRQSE